MRMQQHSKSAVCLFAGHPACKCAHACVKAVATATPSNLYAAEFMLYAFHFANELDTPVNRKNKNIIR